MPYYIYECLDCLAKLNKDFCGCIPIAAYESGVLFETSHAMAPTEIELHAARECPRCGGHNAMQSYSHKNVLSYVRGYGYLDKDGCRRDMNKYKLATDDPYAEYRQPGEVDHIRTELDKQGKHKPNTRHYLVQSTKAVEEAVSKAVHTPNSDS